MIKRYLIWCSGLSFISVKNNIIKMFVENEEIYKSNELSKVFWTTSVITTIPIIHPYLIYMNYKTMFQKQNK
jgi:hypothetical protein